MIELAERGLLDVGLVLPAQPVDAIQAIRGRPVRFGPEWTLGAGINDVPRFWRVE
jgi:hypothetical protein